MSIYSETIKETKVDPGKVNTAMVEIISEEQPLWFGMRSAVNALRPEASWDQEFTGYVRQVPTSLLGLDEDPYEQPALVGRPQPNHFRGGLASVHIELVTAEAAEIERRNETTGLVKDYWINGDGLTPLKRDYSEATDVYAALADLAPDDVGPDDAQAVHAQLDGQTVQAEILPPELVRRPRRPNGQFKKGKR